MKYLVKRVGFYILFCFMLCFLRSHIETAIVFGASMSPTLNPNDFLFLYCTKEVGYGDIVAVYCDVLGEVICKRVIGVSGDIISICDGVVTRNGEELSEFYLGSSYTSGGGLTGNESGLKVLHSDDFMVQVEDGYLFLLGDNRGCSLDSRVLGGFMVSDVRGKVVLNITSDAVTVLVTVIIFVVLSFLVALGLCRCH